MIGPLRDMPEGSKYVVDGLSAATAVATLAQILPALASLLTIIWMGIRIWETPTVRGWFGKKPLDIDSGD